MAIFHVNVRYEVVIYQCIFCYSRMLQTAIAGHRLYGYCISHHHIMAQRAFWQEYCTGTVRKT